MNIIKIYLKESGSTAEVSIDFRLFAGSYRNKHIELYVPKSLLLNNPVVSAVKTGAILTNEKGATITTKSYYAGYVKDETIGGVEYAVYEQYCPKAFTLYAGTQKIVANVVNIDTNNYVVDSTVDEDTRGTYYTREETESGVVYSAIVLDGENFDPTETYYKQVPKYVDITTSQVATIVINESAFLDEEEVIDPSELEVLEGRVSNAESDIVNLQGRTESLEDRVEVAEGNIDDLTERASDLEDAVENITEVQLPTINATLGNHETRITNNSSEIATIKQQIITGKDYIGQMRGSVLPTDDELSEFVEEHTEPSRQAKNGDTIYFVLEITGQPDKRYEYIYTIEGWKGSEIPNAELGSNTEYGLVKGNFDKNQNVEVSIIDGEIKNVYAKDKNGTRRDIQSYLSMNEQNISTNATEVASLKTRATNLENRATSLESRATAVENDIDDIIDGGITVKKAEQDSNGNNIVNTYLTQNAGATKSFVKDYALPKSFNDSYFLANKDDEIKFISSVPTLAEQVEETITASSVGEHTLLQANWYNGTESVAVPYEFEISKKNSCNVDFAVSADRNCSVYFMVYGYLVKGEEETDRHLLFTTRSNVVNLTADNIETVNTTNIFTELAETMKVVEGNRFEFEIGVYTEFSTATEFTLYSNNVFSTDFLLNTTSQTVVVAQGELGEQPVYQSIGLVTESGLEFEIVEELKEDTEALFKLSYQGEELEDTTEVIIKNGEETIRLVTPFNMASGNATIGDLAQLPKDNGVLIFKGFVEKVGSDTILRADMLNLVGGEWGSITGNIENQTDLAGRIFNVINASDIASTNILTEAQYDLITNGKPTLIKGNFLTKHNMLLLTSHNDGSGNIFGFYISQSQTTGSRTDFGQYKIVTSSKVISSVGNPQQIDYTGKINLQLQNINNKAFPTYPTDTTKQYKLVQNISGSLVWVEDTKWGNIGGDIADQTDLADELQDIREIAEGRASAYIIDDLDDITGTRGSDDNYTNVTAINSIPEFVLANAKLGDSILIKDETVGWDYWVSQINKTGDEITSVNLNKTKAIDLSNYVDKTSAETIGGQKTFSDGIKTNSIYPITDNGLTAYSKSNVAVFKLQDSRLDPAINNARDLGGTSLKWRNIYVAGNLSDGTNSITIAQIPTEVEERIIR